MTQFTKKEIKNSLMRLLEDNSFDKITVKDIAEDCNISRNTFYYHYHDIFAVLEDIFDSEIAAVRENLCFDSLKDVIIMTTAFARENKKAILHIHNSSRKEYVLAYMYKIFEASLVKFVHYRAEGLGITEADINLLVVFYKHGMVGLFSEWLDNRMNDVADETIERIAYLLEGNIDKSLNKIIESVK